MIVAMPIASASVTMVRLRIDEGDHLSADPKIVDGTQVVPAQAAVMAEHEDGGGSVTSRNHRACRASVAGRARLYVPGGVLERLVAGE